MVLTLFLGVFSFAKRMALQFGNAEHFWFLLLLQEKWCI